ncbi:hypothetical protein EW145_g281 [Phellinidium pouzarii]|uniref:CENP-C homolog n=1 Tax=Phellinidium pouzarii TaxID=167371 RepID=A0A4S4LKV0_9AGAM|nr:hypothetical protein EW145_g281 [Phellinidium pouzarii]
MSKGRKSSVDNSRRTLKAHIPYRADDLTQGKKTGVNVREVDRRSDGFESFGEVLNQADVFTPPHVRARRRNHHSTSPVTEYDENGEMSMELDDSNIDSPNVYFNRTPRPSAPSSANRSAVSLHAANRSSYIDYDRVPSPRASSSQRIRSQPNGSITPNARLKSNLSQQTVIPSSPDDDDDNDNGDSFGDILGGNDNFDYDPPAPDDSSSPAKRTSFTEMDQDDEPPLPEDPRLSSPPRQTVKRRERISVAAEEIEVEAEIAEGLGDDRQMESDDEAEREKQKSLNQKKRRGRDEEMPKAKKAPVKRKKVQLELPPSESNIVDGVRRGTRTRYKPLDWWRCEKVVYGRRESGVSMVPVIKDIIRLPKEIAQPLTTVKRARSSKPRSRSKPKDNGEDMQETEMVVFNPEDGWDDQTDPHGIVLDYQTGQEVQRRLAFTAKMVIPRSATNNDFSYQKIFGDGEFIAAGQLILPVGGKKPSKGTKDNTYVFYLIEGAVQLKIHRTSFVLASGGMFLIPRGNTYYLENISKRPAKLFFAQARKVNAEDDPAQEIVKVAPPGSSLARIKSVDPSGARRPSGASNGYSSTGAKSGSAARSSSAVVTSSPDKPVERRPSEKRAVSK